MAKRKPRTRKREWNGPTFLARISSLLTRLDGFSVETKISLINDIKLFLSEKSPFSNEPVDCVIWVKNEKVGANDYNPNKVAPPEMALLEHSIAEDGYTQPIVTWKNKSELEVIDGFHRNRVGKESERVQARVNGYLPIVIIGSSRENRNDRIASTIRHNRARGKHSIDAMTDIVVELKKRNWSNNRICKELGMDSDEVLRLCQITGLVELFSDSSFSEAWDSEIFDDDDFNLLDEEEIK